MPTVRYLGLTTLQVYAFSQGAINTVPTVLRDASGNGIFTSGVYNGEIVVAINEDGSMRRGVAGPTDGPIYDAYATPSVWEGLLMASSSGLVYNVKDYGALGNGTTDDTSAISLAIAAAKSSSGGVVYFPPGTYLTTGISATSVDNLVLEGAGATISCSVDAHNVLFLTSCSNFQVRGITFNHKTHAARNSSGYGIHTASCTDGLIEGNVLTNICAAGIFTTTGTRISIIGNSVHDTLADGIHTTATSTQVTVVGNRLANTGDDAIAFVSYQSDSGQNTRCAASGNSVFQSKARGIAVIGGKGITVTGNSIESTTSAGIMVAQDDSYSSRGPSEVTVSGNTVVTANTYNTPAVVQGGIHVSSGNASYPATDINVSANTINAPGNQYILATTSVSNVHVLGNFCTGGNVAGDGIGLIGVSTGTVGENTVLLAFASGINIDAASTNVYCCQNTVIKPNQGSAASKFGVNHLGSGINSWNRVLDDGSKTAITDQHGGTGSIQDSTSSSVSCNQVRSNAATRGVQVQGIGSFVVTRNDGGVAWVSSTDAGAGTMDTVLFRGAAGVVQCSNTTSGGGTGVLQLGSSSSLMSGSGSPNGSVTGSSGDFFFRTDTPSQANQRIYVCTGATTWVGIL